MTVMPFMGLIMNFLELFCPGRRKGTEMFYSDCTKFLDSNPKHLPLGEFA